MRTTRIDGGVTAPAGFRASGLHCGIKKNGKPDLALIVSDAPSTSAAGLFTTNLAKAAPALIMNNGLMQTLAFYQDKNKPQHQALARHLRRWLSVRTGGPDHDVGFEPAMKAMLGFGPDQYRHATDEALLILRWIRQFAAAL